MSSINWTELVTKTGRPQHRGTMVSASKHIRNGITLDLFGLKSDRPKPATFSRRRLRRTDAPIPTDQFSQACLIRGRSAVSKDIEKGANRLREIAWISLLSLRHGDLCRGISPFFQFRTKIFICFGCCFPFCCFSRGSRLHPTSPNLQRVTNERYGPGNRLKTTSCVLDRYCPPGKMKCPKKGLASCGLFIGARQIVSHSLNFVRG